MKILLALSFFLVSHLVLAQVSQFEKIENQINTHIEKNRWDEIMVMAPDLIIEDPSRGEGYYYTALAFFKMGQGNKALEYLVKAENLADEVLKNKISALKKEIQTGKQATQVLADIKKNGNANAAEEWHSLWLLEKTNVEYALNAVEQYIEIKKYPQALEILQDPGISKEPAAQKLIGSINKTPQMVAINGYNQALESGKSKLDNSRYQQAISSFEEALKFMPNDSEAYQLKRKAEDELAWKNTRDKNTIPAFEAYNAGPTLREHREEAHERIKSGLIYFGEKYAKENNVPEMDSYLNKYLSTYPNGSDAGKARQLMCDVYFNNGLASLNLKKEYEQTKAIDFFNKARQMCPANYAIAKPLKIAQRRKTRYGRPNRLYYAIAYDTLSPLGFSMGSVNNQSVGVYFTIRANKDLFTSSTYYTVDNTGTTSGNTLDDIRFNNIVRKGNLEGVLGITKKITYPIWLYTAAGVSYNPVFWEMEEYYNNGDYRGTEWVKNTEETKYKFVADTGVILDLNGLNLRAGLKTYDFANWHLTMGIGFSLKGND